MELRPPGPVTYTRIKEEPETSCLFLEGRWSNDSFGTDHPYKGKLGVLTCYHHVGLLRHISNETEGPRGGNIFQNFEQCLEPIPIGLTDFHPSSS